MAIMSESFRFRSATTTTLKTAYISNAQMYAVRAFIMSEKIR